MEQYPIKPSPVVISQAKSEATKSTATTVESSPPSSTVADSVTVSIPAQRPKPAQSADPESLVNALTQSLQSSNEIADVHGNLDISRIHDLLSED